MFQHLYTGPDGVSKFREMEGKPYERPAKTVSLVRVPAGTDRGSIIPGYSHYVFFMAGQTEIGAGDGTKHVFKAGDVLWIDDVGGKGHTSRVLPGSERVSMHVTLA
jgi:hypothetical protein